MKVKRIEVRLGGNEIRRKETEKEKEKKMEEPQVNQNENEHRNITNIDGEIEKID